MLAWGRRSNGSCTSPAAAPPRRSPARTVAGSRASRMARRRQSCWRRCPSDRTATVSEGLWGRCTGTRRRAQPAVWPGFSPMVRSVARFSRSR